MIIADQDKIFKASYEDLLIALPVMLKAFDYKVKRFGEGNHSCLYFKGSTPVLLVAHLDTVHKQLCTDIVYKKNKNTKNIYISSPQGIGGDDRCGIIMILDILTNTKHRPSILFTCGEEIGGLGATTFIRNVKRLNVNLIVELDRHGYNDVVRYSDDNEALTRAFESVGYVEASGSFTDISIICPHFKLSGVNLSCGYYRAHTIDEYIILNEMQESTKRLIKFLDSDLINVKYVYKPIEYNYKPFSINYFSSAPSNTSVSSTGKSYTVYNVALKSKDFCSLCSEAIGDDEKYYEAYDIGKVCETCASTLVGLYSYTHCPCCGSLILKDDLCQFCGYYPPQNKNNLY